MDPALVASTLPRSPNTLAAGTNVGNIIAADINAHMLKIKLGLEEPAETHRAAQYSAADIPGNGEAFILSKRTHEIRMKP
jgi:hypothetical protein